MPTQTEIDAADRNAREWIWPPAEELPIGSDSHRDATCQMFRDTLNPYNPAVIDWPRLDLDALMRLTSLPIWDIAVSTENRGPARMLACAQAASDPSWRRVIRQNSWEEARDREVLANLVATYGITLAAETRGSPPGDREWGYIVTGYSECIDSFFAFGLFKLARRSAFFPAALVDTFEPVIQEEAVTSCCSPTG